MTKKVTRYARLRLAVLRAAELYEMATNTADRPSRWELLNGIRDLKRDADAIHRRGRTARRKT